MTALRFVLALVSMVGGGLAINSYSNFTLKTNHTVELIWAILPFNILLLISAPSIKTLYLSEPHATGSFTRALTAQAEQWRWSITTTSLGLKKESSVLIGAWQDRLPLKSNPSSKNLIEPPAYRHKNNVLLNGPKLKINITSADVLHSFFLPSLSIKIDAIPGTVQEIITHITREGKFYGICAEYCGFYHRQIPFSIKTVE